MQVVSESTSNGIVERLFTVADIPGALWSPAGAGDEDPLVLLGHGGGHHKTGPAVVSRARRYVADCGFTVVAIDAPGHGDREKFQAGEQVLNGAREEFAAGRSIGPLMTRYNAMLAELAVPEWRAVLDVLPMSGQRPVGYWGVSMGAGIGIPLAAVEPRIRAAVFGLAGGDAIAAAAAQVSIPVEFLLQWDDELVPRASGLALFDAFRSPEKSLHANPGGHREVPPYEVESSQRFFARHLTRA